MAEQTLLSLKIKGLFPEPISDAEASEAAGRLVSFFKILSDVHKQQNGVMNDNFRSKDSVCASK